jgi:hypothetical protein
MPSGFVAWTAVLAAAAALSISLEHQETGDSVEAEQRPLNF